MVDRRGFLAAGGALLLTGCGASRSDDEQAVPGTSETGRRADIEVLNGLIEVERATAERATGRMRSDDQVHIDELSAAIGAAKGTPTTGRLVLHGGLESRKRAALLAYADALPKLSDIGHRKLVAGILTVEAQHLAVLTGEVDGAFVVGERA